MTYSKPSIIVYYYKGLHGDRILKNISWGIEEEGIPCQIKQADEYDAVKLGYLASLESVLDVGIGIGIDGNAVLHHAKLDEKSPLFVLGVKEMNSTLRMLGANAARLVKGIPLKTENDENIDSWGIEKNYISEVDMPAIVTEVLNRIFQK